MHMRKSFTLIELLIVASIVAVLSLSLYSAFATGILSYKKFDSSFETYQSARTTLRKIETDLRNSFPYLKEDSRFIGQPNSIEFFGVVDSYKNGKVYTDICRITYQIDKEVLSRSLYIGLEALRDNTIASAQELSGRVKEVSFQYAYSTDNPDR
ncbi:MAG: prepilin-type N-terminal cleavage/methylation domain-containing protein, partial [Candidatus Omnitrophica bacterium]|nr:prepilin-type N-terminal cleavage/methylation domain-containing protein [Candidatus Omnitrophota bacterium]